LGFLTCHSLRGWIVTAAVAVMCGCAVPTPESRSASIARLAAAQGWQSVQLPGAVFDLQAFAPGHLRETRRLTVYIEGDGLAWLDPHTPSFSPTPVDPLGLRLAMTDASATAVYLGRPCQYTRGPAFKGCEPRYWGSHRFAPEVIDAMDHAVEQLRRRHAAVELVLVGYSGGAAVATLVAARRSDVVALVSVAGTLDTQVWTQEQRLSALQGSLNPKDVAFRVAHLPQWHFIGQKDPVVSRAVLTSFLGAAAGHDRKGTLPTPHVESVPGFDHVCCWADAWPPLSRRFAAQNLKE